MLCFALVAGKVLITQWCSGWCWAVLAQHLHCLPSILAHPISRLGLGKILGGDPTRPTDPNWLKGYSIAYDISSDIKAKKRRRKGAFFIYNVCLLEQPLRMLKPCSQEVAEHRLPMGSRELTYFFSLCLCMRKLSLLL